MSIGSTQSQALRHYEQEKERFEQRLTKFYQEKATALAAAKSDYVTALSDLTISAKGTKEMLKYLRDEIHNIDSIEFDMATEHALFVKAVYDSLEILHKLRKDYIEMEREILKEKPSESFDFNSL